MQVMIEGPGHVPMQMIRRTWTSSCRSADEAPFYTLGPLTTDIARATTTSPAASVRPPSAGTARDAVLRHAEGAPRPAEQDDVKDGIITYKLAAHAADLAKGHPGAQVRDNALSKARFEFRWADQFNLGLDPDKAREFHDETLPKGGQSRPLLLHVRPHFCSMKITQGIGETKRSRKDGGEGGGVCEARAPRCTARCNPRSSSA